MLHIKLAQFAVRCALPPRRSESPVCATDNKPSCVLHLLGWFIRSRGFSSLERRPEFWVLHYHFSEFSYKIKPQLPTVVSGLIFIFCQLLCTVSLSPSSTTVSQIYQPNHLTAFESLSAPRGILKYREIDMYRHTKTR